MSNLTQNNNLNSYLEVEPVDELSITFLEEKMIAPSIGNRKIVKDTLSLPYQKPPSPERNLLASILAFAFLDLQENRSNESRQKAHDYIMGQGMFISKEYQGYIFSVTSICRHLEIDLEIVRKIAKRMFHNPTLFPW